LLLDATIPGLEGREVARQFRASRPDLPVLLTSGYGECEVMRSYAGVAVDGFMQKPFELGHLGDVLRNLLPEEIPASGGSRSANPAPALQPKRTWTGKIVQSWV